MKQTVKITLLFAAIFMLVGCKGEDSELYVKTYESELPQQNSDGGISVKLPYKLLNTWLEKYAVIKSTMERVESRYEGKMAQLELETTQSETAFEKAESELDKILVDKDTNHPDVVFGDLLVQDANSIYGEEGNRIGIVDLGLPSGTKWGNCNIGNSMTAKEFKGFDAFLTLEKPQRPTLDDLSNKPNYGGAANYIAQKAGANNNKANNDVVVTIPYSDYLKRISESISTEDLYMKYFHDNDAMEALCATICEEMYGDYIKRLESNKDLINNYIIDFGNYVVVYGEAKQEYFKYLFDNKYAFIFKSGNTYKWGLGQADDNLSSFPTELDPASAINQHLCTPTLEQVKELKSKCTWKSLTFYDYEETWKTVSYVVVTGPNGNKIGFCNGTYMINYKERGYYHFQINGTRVDVDYSTINNSGLLVRPVYK